MLHSLRKRIERDEDGFTLIELMVVVLIIAILLAIAIPTFLGARERAQNRAAQSDIHYILTAEKTFYTDDEVYTADPALLAQIEPSIQVAATASTDDVGVVVSAVGTAAAKAVCVGKVSESGQSFSVLDVSIGGGAGTFYFTGSSTCAGAPDPDGW